ncbi:MULTISPECIES: hypothetical protein [Streptomyces]|nr:hypothetical protein [Streptomyces canarius]
MDVITLAQQKTIEVLVEHSPRNARTRRISSCTMAGSKDVS